MTKITEGTIPFLGHETYYRIAGDLSSGKTPLLCLHGGPGSTHNYFEIFDELGEERPVISYDQIGCGNSYLDHHPELWNKDTWIHELETLRSALHLDHVHLLGQSWGGMLEIAYMIDKKPSGVSSLILSSTLSSAKLWAGENHRQIHYLPEKEQEAIRRAEESGNFNDPEYLRANEHFMELHCAGPYGEKDPECLRRTKKAGSEAYLTAWGPNEYTPTGTLKDFEYSDRLQEIDVPCLICSGTDDLCTPLVAKTMYDRLPRAKWILYPNARHMCFVDAHDAYMRDLRDWLDRIDRNEISQ